MNAGALAGTARRDASFRGVAIARIPIANVALLDALADEAVSADGGLAGATGAVGTGVRIVAIAVIAGLGASVDEAVATARWLARATRAVRARVRVVTIAIVAGLDA